ncbi:hypothetical protein TRICI_006838 [Trichomonascus ciferrii]|uniref:Uncharacterized protein n=1 Tax=Trichomonascus ciferrii TaxID=44093 RepID=A0A642UCM4_9ASCO|nr:hypothetical protein TRICI_006838 [Trichomonascus ciferrii]
MNVSSFPQNNPQQMMGNEELSIPLPQSREELSRLYTQRQQQQQQQQPQPQQQVPPLQQQQPQQSPNFQHLQQQQPQQQHGFANPAQSPMNGE